MKMYKGIVSRVVRCTDGWVGVAHNEADSQTIANVGPYPTRSEAAVALGRVLRYGNSAFKRFGIKSLDMSNPPGKAPSGPEEFTTVGNPPEVDISIYGEGSVYLVRGVSTAGTEWIDANLPEDAQRLGDSVAVEHRYIDNIATGMLSEGLRVTLNGRALALGNPITLPTPAEAYRDLKKRGLKHHLREGHREARELWQGTETGNPPGKALFERGERVRVNDGSLSGNTGFVTDTSHRGEVRVKLDGHDESLWFNERELDVVRSNPRTVSTPAEAWEVWLRGKMIDKVFATGYDADEMKRSLVDHDGYDPDITVRKERD